MTNKTGSGLAGTIRTMSGERSREKKKEEKKARARKSSTTMMIPWVVFGFSQVVLIFGEFRVFDYIYRLTGNILLALGTLFATGAGADIWFLGWKYNLANTVQKVISIGMMVVNILMAAYIGLGDYFVDSAGSTFGASQQTVFTLIGVVLLLDLVLGLVYYLVDPQVVAQRKAANVVVEMEQRNAQRKLLEGLLVQAKSTMTIYEDMVARFGQDAVTEMMKLFNDGDGVDDELVEKVDAMNNGASFKQFNQPRKPLPQQNYAPLVIPKQEKTFETGRGNGNNNRSLVPVAGEGDAMEEVDFSSFLDDFPKG